jgi:CMP-N-acetylneuraminic acid synthetase
MNKNCALLIGKHNSGSVSGKNYIEILGRPAVEYPLLAASHCKQIDKIHVSTDSPIIMRMDRASVQKLSSVLRSWLELSHPRSLFFSTPTKLLKRKSRSLK